MLYASCSAAGAAELSDLTLERLLNIDVIGASKYRQKQSEVAAAVSVITRDEIKAFGWRTLEQALATLPGVYVTYDRQYTYLGTRGLGLPGDYNTRMLVTINGNRVNDVVYDQGPLGREFPLDMDLVERIEFIPGPGGAVYGQNAMLAVVNVVTRSGAGVAGTELAAGYQTPQRAGEGRVSWGHRLDNGVDVLLSASGYHAGGEDRFFDFGASNVSGVARGLDGERNEQFFGRIAHGPWSMDLTYGDRRKDDPTGVYHSDPLVPGQFQEDRYTLLQGQYQDNFRNDTLQLTARLFVGDERYTSILSYGTPYSYPGTSDWRGAEVRLVSTALADHKLMLGLEAQDNSRIDQAILDLAHPANNILMPDSGYRIGVYGQDEWRLTRTLTATLGLRIDRNNVTRSNTSPRLGLIWQAEATTTLKALYGGAHRAPNAYERDYYDNTAQESNHSLRGESMTTGEIVLDHRIAPDTHVRASVYRWTMRDQIVLGTDPLTGLAQYQSGMTAHAQGVEVSADKNWSWGGRIRGSVSSQHAEYVDGTSLVNSPRWLGKLNFSTPLPLAGLRVGYELQYESARRTLVGTNVGGYVLSNIHLGAEQWVKGLDLGLGIRNLFDKRYFLPGSSDNWQNALEQDGRSIRIEARYKL